MEGTPKKGGAWAPVCDFKPVTFCLCRFCLEDFFYANLYHVYSGLKTRESTKTPPFCCMAIPKLSLHHASTSEFHGRVVSHIRLLLDLLDLSKGTIGTHHGNRT